MKQPLEVEPAVQQGEEVGVGTARRKRRLEKRSNCRPPA
jgi:hypothetical protein